MKKKMLVMGVMVGLLGIGGTIAVVKMQTPVQVGANFSATLSGREEVPPTASAATGMASFMLSPDGMMLTFTLSVSNINNVTASHIHLAAAGVNGAVVVPLFAGPKPGPFSGVLAQGTITAAELRGSLLGMPLSALVTEMRAGNTYVNVHTTANPAGDIRGQIRQALP